MVTGEPSSRSRPSRGARVRRPWSTASRPTALCSAIGRTNCRRTVDDAKTVRRERARRRRARRMTRYASVFAPERVARGGGRRSRARRGSRAPGKSTTTRQRETRHSSATHVCQSIACISTRRHTAASKLRSADWQRVRVADARRSHRRRRAAARAARHRQHLDRRVDARDERAGLRQSRWPRVPCRCRRRALAGRPRGASASSSRPLLTSRAGIARSARRTAARRSPRRRRGSA